MKYRITAVAALVAALSLPVPAHADEHAVSSPVVTAEKPAAQPSMGGMPCPMMGSMGSMQKNMGDMMGDMNSMMQMMSDPAVKERMQKMHENMGAMMQQMTVMQKGMMQDGKTKSEKANDAPAAAADDHHPDKQQ